VSVDPPPLISLLTDFGLTDGYVGAMKGVILGITPHARIVDLSHEVPPQDVAAGAFILGRAYPYFSAATIHVAVVDPGVGSNRRPILLRCARGTFIGPDNGIFEAVLATEPDVEAYELNAPAYWLPQISTTFHGRDVFAPSAAHLAGGVPPTRLGRRVPLDTLVRLPHPEPRRGAEAVYGQIIYVDHFGNAVSNIPAAWVDALGPRAGLEVVLGPLRLRGVHATYADVLPGEPLALVASAGLLEVAIRDGNAARGLGVRDGDRLECHGESA